jgi:hypothetical protein
MTSDSGNTTLAWSEVERDLGILVDTELKYREEIRTRVCKATSIVGIIRRTFTFLDEDMFVKFFKGLVRPHLEYASLAWTPTTIKETKDIEAVQRRATKQIPTLKNLEYEERLRKLKLPTLKFRRHRGDMIETYKILHRVYDTDPGIFFHRSQTNTRGHTLKLEKRRAETPCRYRTFSTRVINSWNSLPEEVVSAPSLQAFKNRLDRHWKNHPDQYKAP